MLYYIGISAIYLQRASCVYARACTSHGVSLNGN